MNIVKVSTTSHIAPGYWGLSNCEPNANTGLVEVELIAKWRGSNRVLLRPHEYTITDGIVGGADVNSIDKLILSQIVQNGRWLIKNGSITDIRAHIAAECEQNDIQPTEEEITDALKEQE